MNRNSLLEMLPLEIRQAILSKAIIVDLKLSHTVCKVNEPLDTIYFPIDSFISIIQCVDDRPSIEIGLIGREGVIGSEISIGMQSNPFDAIVQGSGKAWKIKSSDFSSSLDTIPELKTLLHSYLKVRICQLGLSAACEHFHEIGPRLAKWLLMSQDRAQSPYFVMTHEFISLMLGVRRVGVTTIAADFRRRGLIDYHRGEMKILNRVALKAEACSCYLANKRIYSSYIN